MTKINPHLLKKAELLELMTGRCKHSHTYIEHPNCWYAEKKRESIVWKTIYPEFISHSRIRHGRGI